MADCPGVGMEDCSSAFKRVTLSRTIDDMTIIQWELANGFDPGPNPTFTVQFSTSGLTTSDDWQNIPPVNTSDYVLIDNTPLWSYDQGPHYRVVMFTGTDIYRSAPVRWGTQFETKRDWLMYREILRRFCVDLRKGDGREGMLLKRRNWGERCPRCRHFDTGEVTDSKCPVCYATGIRYGYFDPVVFWTKLDPFARETKSDPNVGMIEPIPRIAQAPGVPYIETTDVWVDLHADKRYFIHPIAAVELVRDVEVIVRICMNLAEPTNIIYMVPLTPREISSSSSSA